MADILKVYPKTQGWTQRLVVFSGGCLQPSLDHEFENIFIYSKHRHINPQYDGACDALTDKRW